MDLEAMLRRFSETISKKIDEKLDEIKIEFVKQEEESIVKNEEINKGYEYYSKEGCNIKFKNSLEHNPFEFMAEYERKIGNVNDTLDRFEQCLEGSALSWFKYTISEGKLDGIRESFLEYFWGFKQQEAVVEQLYTGKFVFGRKEGIDEYLIKTYLRVKNAHLFPMSEKLIVRELSAHCGETFYMAVLIRGITNFKDLLEAVNNFDEEMLRVDCRYNNNNNCNNKNNWYINNNNHNNVGYRSRLISKCNNDYVGSYKNSKN